MDANEARQIVIEAFGRVAAGGFGVGGHWDDSIVLLISREFSKVDVWTQISNEIRYSENNYAEITVHDEDFRAITPILLAENS